MSSLIRCDVMIWVVDTTIQLSTDATEEESNHPLKRISPTFLLPTEISVSLWALYQSLGETMAAAGMVLALAFLMFVSISHLLHHHQLPCEEMTNDSAYSSFGSGRQPFTTPIMRKLILGEEDKGAV